MTARVLPLVLLATILCAAATAKTSKTDPAEGGGALAQRWRATGWSHVAEAPEAETGPGLIAGGRTVVGRVSPYWRLERRYVRQQHALGRANRTVRRLRAQRATRTLQAARSTEQTIRLVFWNRGDEAVRVSSCETGGTFSTTATNGQFLGIFQFGEYARSTYGFGPTVLEQALAAYRYFVASGYSWGPWECKP